MASIKAMNQSVEHLATSTTHIHRLNLYNHNSLPKGTVQMRIVKQTNYHGTKDQTCSIDLKSISHRRVIEGITWHCNVVEAQCLMRLWSLSLNSTNL